MSIRVAAGGFLLVAPLWFTTTFALLGKRFDYPDILRRPVTEILDRFRAGGSSLILLWWMFMVSGILLIPAVVLLGQALGFEGIVPLAVTAGVIAALVQVLGLLRWVYLVPTLARMEEEAAPGDAQRDVAVAIFSAMHRYVGVGIGEHLGYLFTGLWSLLTGVAILGTHPIPGWIGWVGISVGAGLVAGSGEFLGRDEDRGWALARAAIPILYIVWSLWLVGMGITLII
ncbi:MAG TPA: DUF4386 domain-containing protein [Actinomycetota bacterium]|nr:DUF4386 domain-containing protein [Actinomycetota bacterium]